ncbi:cell division protein ZapA [Paracoccus aerius]
MAEVDFTIGHKEYRLAAQDGEERLLQRAAALLDAEAQHILAQAGRTPEPRLLLLAGLMLADKVATLEERAEKAERHLNRLQANPTRVEVPVIPRTSRRRWPNWRRAPIIGRPPGRAGRLLTAS